MAVIANVALTNTFDTWRTRSNIGFTRLNAFAINESSLYANTLTSNVAFTSKGLATFNGRATVGTNLTVSGNTTLGAANKTANATGWFGITGRATISTNLFVGGNSTVVGTTTFRGPVNIGDGASDLLTITGRAAISQNLTVSGNTTLGAAGKVFSSTGLFNHVGRQTISTNLYVAGNTILGNANVVTDRTIVNGVLVSNGQLTVTGNTSLAGTTTDNSNALSQTLTDGVTITWNTALGRVATVTLGGNRTISAATNQKVGTYILRVVQDATGSRTLTWNGNYKWTAQTAPVLSTAVGAVDIITLFSDGTKMYGSYLPDVR
jgi:hypothetical protein